jgi:hypothetical protein
VEAQRRCKGSVWQSKRGLEDLLLGFSDFPSAGRQREIPWSGMEPFCFSRRQALILTLETHFSDYAVICEGDNTPERPSGLVGLETMNWALADGVVSHDRFRWAVHGCKACGSLRENAISRL